MNKTIMCDLTISLKRKEELDNLAKLGILLEIYDSEILLDVNKFLKTTPPNTFEQKNELWNLQKH